MTDQIENQENIEKTDETVTTQEKKEKVLTQSEVNALLAKEKRDWTKKLEVIQNEFTTYKTSIEEKENAQTEKIKVKVDSLKAGMDDSVIKLLDKLTVQEQFEWLEENKIEKKTIPTTPKGNGEETKQPKPIGTIF